MTIPPEVQSILAVLHRAGFAAYVVGGSVRDMVLERTPKDWDVTTNATPDQIKKIFPRHFYNNKFGTVTVLIEEKEVEVTTYRIDGGYSDQRHPDQVIFTNRLEEDLARRDFTINAMALQLSTSPNLPSPEGVDKSVVINNFRIIDPFGGLKDLNNKIIRAVGNPTDRFNEDALRIVRAVRCASELGFAIEEATFTAITKTADAIQAVSQERIRDEVIKIIISPHPEKGLNLLKETGLLVRLLPEIAEGIGIEQNKHHIYTVYDHNVKSLGFAARYNYPFHIRLAALLHDIGKPRTRKLAPSVQGKAPDYTFYGHDIVGARMAEKLMKRLKFSNEEIASVTHLVRHHMFYYDIGKITEAGIRRLLRRVGPDNFADLIKLRIAERKGSGVPKAEPYRLRHLQFMAEKVSQAPITVSQLAINGHDLMKKIGLPPGPQIGGILNALLAQVIEDPSKNNAEYLLTQARALKDKDPAALKKLGASAVERKEKIREDDIRRKYHV